MQTATIKMDKWDADAALRKSRREIATYRKGLKQRKAGDIELAREQMEREDEEMDAIYRAISQGHQVLNLLESFRITGCDESGLPKLAIARADRMKVFYDSDRSGGIMYSERWRRGPRSTRINIPQNYLPGFKSFTHTFEAVVPLIPVRFRPHAKLERYHILFEAEWKKRIPVDPMLLRHIGGVHYAVLAHWDLTEVERAALFGRLV